MIQQCSAELTHSENGTGIGNEMRTAIIHAEGVLFGGREGQATSSTPEACGVPFRHPRRRRASCGDDQLGGLTAGARSVRACSVGIGNSPD